MQDCAQEVLSSSAIRKCDLACDAGSMIEKCNHRVWQGKISQLRGHQSFVAWLLHQTLSSQGVCLAWPAGCLILRLWPSHTPKHHPSHS